MQYVTGLNGSNDIHLAICALCNSFRDSDFVSRSFLGSCLERGVTFSHFFTTYSRRRETTRASQQSFTLHESIQIEGVRCTLHSIQCYNDDGDDGQRRNSICHVYPGAKLRDLPGERWPLPLDGHHLPGVHTGSPSSVATRYVLYDTSLCEHGL
jgi:hypothetical protein